MKKLFILFLSLASVASWAQDEAPVSPLQCVWPIYKENATELEKIVTDMDSSMFCVNKTAGRWLAELEELGKFLEGKDILDAFKKRLRVVQYSYQYLKTTCSKDESKTLTHCISFNEKILNSEWIKIVYFHSVIMLNDVELLKSWVSNMPIYDANKMIHVKRLQMSSFRFTLAEKVAGAPYMKIEILRTLGDLGLLNPKSDESFPVSYAISNNQLEKLKYLMEYGFDPNQSDYKPLDRYMTQKQLARAEPNDGYPPLIRAIGYENKEMVDYLMGLPNIDLNQVGPDKNSPLMIAAHHISFGGSAYAYEKLINDPRADINHQNRGGLTLVNWLGDFGAPEAEVKRITSSAAFDPEKNCIATYPCLASVIRWKSLTKVKAYQPLFSAINKDARAYSIGKTQDLTVFEYIDRLIELEKDKKKAKELKKIKKYLLSQLSN